MSRQNKKELKRIGKNIKFLRKNLGYSQEKLAEKIGMSRNYVGMIERAETNTPIETLLNIAKVLNINIKDLF